MLLIALLQFITINQNIWVELKITNENKDIFTRTKKNSQIKSINATLIIEVQIY